MNNSLFRKSFFGGWKKEDVEEYIQNLEHEIESIKVMHQKEKNDLLKKVEEYEENGTTGENVDIQLRRTLEEVTQKLNRSEQEKMELLKEKEIWEEEKAQKQKREDETEKHFKQNADQEETEWKRENLKLREENEMLKKQIQKQQEESYRKDHKPAEDMEPFFDYDTVSKIIEQANQNAEVIKKEAELEAKQILEDVQKEAEYERGRIASKVNSQLEEKGIQLMAAKYKIEQYVKELDSLQQGMYNLSSRMSKLVNTMPVRLDDYWEGEHYRMLENRKTSSDEKTKKE